MFSHGFPRFGKISIHALREEGDFRSTLRIRQTACISIHALREEGDRASRRRAKIPLHFYPRPPRGGRPPPFCILCCVHHFYPRPPRGGRRWLPRSFVCFSHISIHALREEGDQMFHFFSFAYSHFYPRPPRGGRRQRGKMLCMGRRISIHALREEGDVDEVLPGDTFNVFLSTPSARRAT